jgi:hypothetical protein
MNMFSTSLSSSQFSASAVAFAVSAVEAEAAEKPTTNRRMYSKKEEESNRAGAVPQLATKVENQDLFRSAKSDAASVGQKGPETVATSDDSKHRINTEVDLSAFRVSTKDLETPLDMVYETGHATSQSSQTQIR